ncbi:ABC transporter ATP-binding protein [Paracoccus suum]|uniref:ABC transporter ATP-binding protein n=1 Tax=Paracoccus suum TaxID=2259340 RepID=A0A344PLS2_9RHOB|nr:ABC transporter ATP-binding protein [Paracoccus suum]
MIDDPRLAASQPRNLTSGQTAPPATPAIEITGLRKTYAPAGRGAPREALRGIDLTIPAGSIFGLLGPNGAGKSTTINILAGLVRKTEGRVTIWGFDQDVNPRQSRAAIGVMPQELNIDPFLSPRVSLEMQAGLYGVPPRERWTDELLALVGLSDQAEAYSRNLSGGMKRRLLLAKALVHRPQVLVLDEPTAGVDIGLREMLWTNVRRLNAQGMTIILTTHYLEEAQSMCDEIAIIDRGQLVTRASTSDLLAAADRKVLVIDSGGASAPPMPEGVAVSVRDRGRLAFTYAPSQVSADAILEALRLGGVRVRDLSTEEADLEDVFRSFVG